MDSLIYALIMYNTICMFTPESTQHDQVPDSLQYLILTEEDEQYIEDNYEVALSMLSHSKKKQLKTVVHYANIAAEQYYWNDEFIEKVKNKNVELTSETIGIVKGGFKFKRHYLSDRKELKEVIKTIIETKGEETKCSQWSTRLFHKYDEEYTKLCIDVAKKEIQSYFYLGNEVCMK